MSDMFMGIAFYTFSVHTLKV